MTSYSGILHKYNASKVAFEFTPSKLPNVLIMIGGMTDGLLTVPYVSNLPRVMEPLGYSVIQIQLTSSFQGWGMTSLKHDVAEINELIRYLRTKECGERKKVVIMGHSTGSQDVMLYMLSHPDTIDAGIMQGSVSDRESIEAPKEVLDELTRKAKELCDNGKPSQLLSHEYSKYMFDTPMTAYRWCSLLIPGGDDDYFSSDLPIDALKKSFGQLKKPFLIAYSGEDEFVPSYVDKSKVITTWKSVTDPKVWSQNSGLIQGGATHGVDSEEAQQHLFSMITKFFTEFDL